MKQCKVRLFLLVMVSVILGACSKDDNTDIDLNANGIAVTDLSNNQIESRGGSFYLTIKAKGEWELNFDKKLCSFNTTSGVGEIRVVGYVNPNHSANERSIVLTILHNGKKNKLTITQIKGDGTSTDPEDPNTEDPNTEDPNTEKPGGNAGRLEIPKLKGGEMNLFYTHTVNYNGQKVVNYSAEYDCIKKHPRWVAFFYDNVNCQKNTKRSDAWADDPSIPSKYRTVSSDYKGRYNRGHLVASSDRYLSREANQQTFYYSNMSPQITTFNGGIWNVMERKVQDWGQISNSRDTLYIVKGGKIDGTVEDGTLIEYTGPSRVAVPRYYFMALLSLKNGKYSAMAFYINQEKFSSSDIFTYAISVSELQKNTGLDFFHNLPDNIEKQVEGTFNRGDWN